MKQILRFMARSNKKNASKQRSPPRRVLSSAKTKHDNKRRAVTFREEVVNGVSGMRVLVRKAKNDQKGFTRDPFVGEAQCR